MSRLKSWLLSNTVKLIQRTRADIALQVMFLTAFGMLFSLIVDILIATRLGTTLTTDALVVALSIPRLIETICREGSRFSLTSLFIEVRQSTSEAEFSSYFSGLLNLFFATGIAFFLLCFLAAPYIVFVAGPGLPPSYQDEAVQILRLAATLITFALGGTVVEAALNSQKRFLVVASRNVIVLGSVTVVIIAGWERNNISNWIAIAYGFGYLLFFCWILGYSLYYTDLKYLPRSWPSRAILVQISRPILFPTASLGIRQLSRVAERAFASTVSPGGTSIYYFSFRLISAAQSIIGISVTTISLPRLSELALSKRYKTLLEQIIASARRISVLGFVAILIITFFSESIIELLFDRGNVEQFSLDQLQMILRVLSLSLIFWSLGPLFSSVLIALNKHSLVLLKTIITILVNFSLLLLFVSPLGLVGIALASTIATTIGTCILIIMILFLLRPRFWIRGHGSLNEK